MSGLFLHAIEMFFDAVFVVGQNLKIEECNSKFASIFCGGRDPHGKLLLEAVRSVPLFEAVSAATSGRTTAFEFNFAERSFFAHVRYFEKEKKTVCVIKDETAMKMLERVRKDFVANMTHQMKTPLTSIIGYSETIASGGVDDISTAKEFSKVINESAVKLRDLIDEILTLSKVESGMIEVKKVTVDIFELLLKCLKPFAGNKNGVEIELLGENGLISTDAWMLEHIVSNLLDNAVKFSKPHSKVIVNVSKQSANWVISIADSGRGIPEDQLHRVFERFYQVDDGAGKGGFGLGLAIAKHFAEKLNAEIMIESFPEKGSVFSIVLPE